MEFTGTIAAAQDTFNASVDNFRLANLPMIKFEPTLWAKIKQWLKKNVWRRIFPLSDLQKQIDSFADFLEKCKSPCLLMHPDTLAKFPRGVFFGHYAARYAVRKDKFMEKDVIAAIDLAYIPTQKLLIDKDLKQEIFSFRS